LVSPTCANPNNLAAADLNGDSLVDVVVSCASSNSVGVLLGNGLGTFISNTYPAELDPRGVAIADFNGDGQPDIAVVNGGSGDMNVLLQIHGIVASDQAPVAVSAPFSVQGSVTAANGAFEAFDPDGDALTYVVVNQPATGTFTYSTTSGAFAYLARAGYVGPDAVTFQVSDGVKISQVATVSVTVTSSSSGGGSHKFLGGLALPLLPLLGLFVVLRRRRS
jgi:hypothetical protein